MVWGRKSSGVDKLKHRTMRRIILRMRGREENIEEEKRRQERREERGSKEERREEKRRYC